MARVELRHIHKSYPGVQALDDVDLAIESGEFFTLLGPSGCGKTTLLRTVAGFTRQDSGEVRVGGQRIDDMPAYRRNIGLVFQDYAIFPHMTVGDNVAFGLRSRRRPRQEIAERVARALDLVRLGGHAARLPHQLSGGQQQRVGLARAMVINPQILLMDEPLSNLDAKLRIELRDDIRDLQRSLGITTIYVTHDQEEALVISDRICVMQGGHVHQVGTPWEVYARPATLFVASFVGAMNVIADLPVGAGGTLALGAAPRPVPALAGRDRVTLAIRLEDMTLAGPADAAPSDALALVGAVDKVTFAGREAFYRVRLDDGPQILAHVHRPERGLLEEAGARLRLILPLARLHMFDPATGRRIEAAS
jgi:iron(III) transport system ATP-binding protein